MLRGVPLASNISPCGVAIDPERMKKNSWVGFATGMDGSIHGSKRGGAVDSFGYPIVVCLTAANVSTNQAGKTLTDRPDCKRQAWPQTTANRITFTGRASKRGCCTGEQDLSFASFARNDIVTDHSAVLADGYTGAAPF